MSIYLVNQGKTYKDEREGGYMWSPKLDVQGRQNAGYTLMTSVKRGDFILHNSGGKISSISIVVKDCYDAMQPDELHNSQTEYEWSDDGYRIDTEYYDFDVPLINSDIATWAKNHPATDSCFDTKGKLKLRYLCNVTQGHARYMLKEAFRLQKASDVRGVIYQALVDMEANDDDYAEDEKDIIEIIVTDQTGREKHYSGEAREPQAMTTPGGTSKPKPKRDAQRAANALQNADYKCEFDETDRTFLRKNGKPYTEPHHLIPISWYADFNYSVDVEENIVSLCSHCHNLLHYGRMEDKERVLKKLYDNRIVMLKKAGLDLTFEKLTFYYT
jgi:predicted HNH restriction endonuclease